MRPYEVIRSTSNYFEFWAIHSLWFHQLCLKWSLPKWKIKTNFLFHGKKPIIINYIFSWNWFFKSKQKLIIIHEKKYIYLKKINILQEKFRNGHYLPISVHTNTGLYLVSTDHLLTWDSRPFSWSRRASASGPMSNLV